MKTLTLSMEGLDADLGYFGHQVQYASESFLAMESEEGQGVLARLKDRVVAMFKWIGEMSSRLLAWIKSFFKNSQIKDAPAKLPLDPSKAVRQIPKPDEDVDPRVKDVVAKFNKTLVYLETFEIILGQWANKSAFLALYLRESESAAENFVDDQLNPSNRGANEHVDEIMSITESSRDNGTKAAMLHGVIDKYHEFGQKLFGNNSAAAGIEQVSNATTTRLKDKAVDRKSIAPLYGALYSLFASPEAQKKIERSLENRERQVAHLTSEIDKLSEGDENAVDYFKALVAARGVIQDSWMAVKQYYKEIYFPARHICKDAIELVQNATNLTVALKEVDRSGLDAKSLSELKLVEQQARDLHLVAQA